MNISRLLWMACLLVGCGAQIFYAGTYTVVVTSFSPGTTGNYVVMADT